MLDSGIAALGSVAWSGPSASDASLWRSGVYRGEQSRVGDAGLTPASKLRVDTSAVADFSFSSGAGTPAHYGAVSRYTAAPQTPSQQRLAASSSNSTWNKGMLDIASCLQSLDIGGGSIAETFKRVSLVDTKTGAGASAASAAKPVAAPLPSTPVTAVAAAAAVSTPLNDVVFMRRGKTVRIVEPASAGGSASGATADAATGETGAKAPASVGAFVPTPLDDELDYILQCLETTQPVYGSYTDVASGRAASLQVDPNKPSPPGQRLFLVAWPAWSRPIWVCVPKNKTVGDLIDSTASAIASYLRKILQGSLDVSLDAEVLYSRGVELREEHLAQVFTQAAHLLADFHAEHCQRRQMIAAVGAAHDRATVQLLRPVALARNQLAATPRSAIKQQQQQQQNVPAAVGKHSPLLPQLGLLQNYGYAMEPSLAVLSAMTEEQLSRVENFAVNREGMGRILWPGFTDVRGLPLHAILRINPGDISAYAMDGALDHEDVDGDMDGGDFAHGGGSGAGDEDQVDPLGPPTEARPPLGQGLNKPALLTLLGIFSLPGEDPKVVQQHSIRLTSARIARLEAALREETEAMGARFVAYAPSKGAWTFEVPSL
jgi:hypothetical protein